MYTARPLDPRGFEISPGNRLDLDVTIPADAAGTTLAIVDRFTRDPLPLAAIRVAGDPVATPDVRVAGARLRARLEGGARRRARRTPSP